MRTEQEMMELILDVARKDARIRAVHLCGSRCNQNAPRDIFQDFDIVYVVHDIQPFLEDPGWIDVFGERLMMQLPVENDRAMGLDVDEESYAYLIQLADGNRVDCVLKTLKASLVELSESRLKKVLLDKEGILPILPEASDETHWVQRPSKEAYDACCNEFWWIWLNAAKGLWRGELLYAMEMLDACIRPELLRMLSWMAGARRNFGCSVGKCGKYLDRFLEKEEWEAYLATFFRADPEEIWQAADVMCALFSDTAKKVGEMLGYPYTEAWETGSRTYLERVRSLPKDAENIF